MKGKQKFYFVVGLIGVYLYLFFIFYAIIFMKPFVFTLSLIVLLMSIAISIKYLKGVFTYEFRSKRTLSDTVQ